MSRLWDWLTPSHPANEQKNEPIVEDEPEDFTVVAKIVNVKISQSFNGQNWRTVTSEVPYEGKTMVYVHLYQADYILLDLTSKERSLFSKKIKDEDIFGEPRSKSGWSEHCVLHIKPKVDAIPRIIKKVNEQFPQSHAHADFMVGTCYDKEELENDEEKEYSFSS